MVWLSVEGQRHGRGLATPRPNSVIDSMDKQTKICPKCGKPAWAPYLMAVTKKYGQVYQYKVYRHPDGRRRTPRKCTVRILDKENTLSEENLVFKATSPSN
jgi:hypothetical protein